MLSEFWASEDVKVSTLRIVCVSGPRASTTKPWISPIAVLARSRGASAAVAVGSVIAAGAGTALATTGRGIASSRAALTRRLATATLAERAPAIPDSAGFPQFGTVPFVTPNDDFYRIDVALQIPAVRAEDWSMRIHGRVERELVLTVDDLLARPLVERTITMTCVSNTVGGNLVSTARFVGVDLAPLLRDAGVAPEADQIVSTSRDGWTAGTPTATVLEPGRGAMLALGMNGAALPAEHGFRCGWSSPACTATCRPPSGWPSWS